MTAKLSPSAARQKWLETSVRDLRKLFARNGYTVPANVRVSIGHPRGRKGRKAMGQCWDARASADKHFEIFIAPSHGKGGYDETELLNTVAHELAHATVGLKAGHGPAFAKCVQAIGLMLPARSTPSGPAFKLWAADFVRRVGSYPAGKLADIGETTGPRKQGTRLLKCECPECGYIARVTAKWIEAAGAPICPIDEVPLECKGA